LYTVAFEWDPKKSATNVRKHGIEFADAVSALEDPGVLNMQEDHEEEERWAALGMDAFGRILLVIYTLRDESFRMISARTATPNERQQYLESI